MKKFSFKITELKDTKTLVYQLVKEQTRSKADVLDDIKLVKLDKESEKIKVNESESNISTYYINSDNAEIILITMWDNKYIVNGGMFDGKELKISTKPKGIVYNKFENNKEPEYFSYIPSENRKVFLIDLDKGQELELEKVVKDGIEYKLCSLKPNHKYLAIEYRGGEYKTIATGVCNFEKGEDKYVAIINPEEARRIEYVSFELEIEKGNYRKVPILKEKNREI